MSKTLARPGERPSLRFARTQLGEPYTFGTKAAKKERHYGVCKKKECHAKPTHAITWAEGKARFAVCDDHLKWGKSEADGPSKYGIDFVHKLKNDGTVGERVEKKALVRPGVTWSDLELKLVTPGGRIGSARPLGTPGGRQNWVDKAGGLPHYVRIVANGLLKHGHSKSRAISLAVGAVKRWARGGGNVSPKVRAAAVKAVAEWEAKKGIGRARKALNGELSVETKRFTSGAADKGKRPFRARHISVPGGGTTHESRSRRRPDHHGSDKDDIGTRYQHAKNPPGGRDSDGNGKSDRNEAGSRRSSSSGWDEDKHPRGKKGTTEGGRFVKSDYGTGERDEKGEAKHRRENAAMLQEKLLNRGRLKPGARGVEVRYLQDLLQEGGFGKFVLNGVYGPKTIAAVKKAQHEMGLPVTGNVDRKFIKQLINGTGEQHTHKAKTSSHGDKPNDVKKKNEDDGDNDGKPVKHVPK